MNINIPIIEKGGEEREGIGKKGKNAYALFRITYTKPLIEIEHLEDKKTFEKVYHLKDGTMTKQATSFLRSSGYEVIGSIITDTTILIAEKVYRY